MILSILIGIYKILLTIFIYIVNTRPYRQHYRSCTGPFIKTNYRILFPIAYWDRKNKVAQHAILNDSYSHHVGL